jgi:hypothetical protein
MAIFTMLVLPIHEHGRSFPSSDVFFDFSLQWLIVFIKNIFGFLFKHLILRYLIVFEAIVNGIVSLISFSVCALLEYRKATDFCMLILCQKFMISSRFFFLVEFLGSLRYQIMSSANTDSLNSSFRI